MSIHTPLPRVLFEAASQMPESTLSYYCLRHKKAGLTIARHVSSWGKKLKLASSARMFRSSCKMPWSTDVICAPLKTDVFSGLADRLPHEATMPFTDPTTSFIKGNSVLCKEPPSVGCVSQLQRGRGSLYMSDRLELQKNTVTASQKHV